MPLLSLPNELLDHVFSFLDLSSSLALGDSCFRTRGILTRQDTFRSLLKRTPSNVQMLETLIDFLGKIRGARPLVEQLYKKILHDFPASGDSLADCEDIQEETESILVTSSMFNVRVVVFVSLAGLFLLTKLAKRCHQPLPVIKKVKMYEIHEDQLVALASCIQEQEARWKACQVIKMSSTVNYKVISGPQLMALTSFIREQQMETLEAGTISCCTEEEGWALVQLLTSCSWTLEALRLGGTVGSGTWEGLARVAEGLWCGSVFTTKEVIARGRREDVRKVWQMVARVEGWVVDGRRIRYDEPREEGWRRFEQWIDWQA